ncbi:MAG TPA: SHOCT domain-containing protein [Candidatus Methylomirabilis sp.]|nr:SHOCT domain-containing protein [Candidatus Methylomirabilis sp.]
MMWYWGNGAHWWAMLIGLVVMIAFWGVIGWAIWYFVTGSTSQPEQSGRTDDAKRILDQRLARGEIDAEEYRRLREVMGGDGTRAVDGHSAVGTGGQR